MLLRITVALPLTAGRILLFGLNNRLFRLLLSNGVMLGGEGLALR